jgi:hypothetical protein
MMPAGGILVLELRYNTQIKIIKTTEDWGI